MEKQKCETMHRFIDAVYSNGVDQYDNPYPGHTMKLLHCEYPVVRHTPKGIWIDMHGDERFVLLSGVKRFAHPTAEEAIQGLIGRKAAHVRHCQARLALAEEALELAKRTLHRLPSPPAEG